MLYVVGSVLSSVGTWINYFAYCKTLYLYGFSQFMYLNFNNILATKWDVQNSWPLENYTAWLIFSFGNPSVFVKENKKEWLKILANFVYHNIPMYVLFICYI